MPGVLITGAALIQLATACGVGPHGEPAPIDTITRIVMHESQGNPSATNLNKNGTTDYGLAQINSSNFGLLGLTPQTALDPCRNIQAEAALLRMLSLYATGSSSRGFTLAPPGQTVSYVQSMSDPRYRVTEGNVQALPLHQVRAQLLSFATTSK